MTKEILIVHDDQESPAERRTLLETAGYRVTLLQSAPAALRAIERRRPALVLTDVLVHGMTGFELCRAIRERWSAEELPVAIASYIYCLPVFREAALEAGAQEFVVKPIAPAELLKLVQNLTSPKPAPQVAS